MDQWSFRRDAAARLSRPSVRASRTSAWNRGSPRCSSNGKNAGSTPSSLATSAKVRMPTSLDARTNGTTSVISVSQPRRRELRLEKLARRYGIRGPAPIGFVAFGHDDERVVHTGQSRGDLRDDLVGEPKER